MSAANGFPSQGRAGRSARAADPRLVVAALILLAWTGAPRAASRPEPGLAVTITSETAKVSDTSMAPGVSLFVASGQAPTPFVPAGKFEAVWNGAIHAELRGTFRFRADLRGALKVEINGTNVLDVTDGASPLSRPVQLNKGSNAFRAVFQSPVQGDAFVRLSWTEQGTNTSPIPPAVFTPAALPAAGNSAQLRLGRELFLEHRCIRCHKDETILPGGVPELAMDAPLLEGIGARRHFDWMARWVLNPKLLRPTATMPKLLSGATAQADAEAIAAYLASLQAGGEVKVVETSFQTRQAVPKRDGDEPAVAGEAKPLYERLHCAGCHNPPGTAQPDPTKLSQQRIAEKFPSGRLAEFLRAPEAHYAWTRMPGFHLSAAEAKELEDWLFAVAPKPELKPAPTEAAQIEKGNGLVQKLGCLNCHAMKLENQFASTTTMAVLEGRHRKLRSKVPEGDCLGAKPAADYGFTSEQKAALQAFTRTGFASLTRPAPAEFAERQTRLLNCAACHGQIEGFPPLDLLGAKLKPEWMAKFIAGDIPHKMRFDAHPTGLPWLDARMPAFKARAAALATGLAAQAGFPTTSPPEPPVDAELAKAGHKLVGKDGGLSCIQCHAVGPWLAMDVFESEGLNLAWSADRLQPEFYRRWLRAPLSVDPQTKMPTYFEDGRSPITDVLDGDAERQISAIWEYLRQRDRMPAPRTGAE